MLLQLQAVLTTLLASAVDVTGGLKLCRDLDNGLYPGISCIVVGDEPFVRGGSFGTGAAIRVLTDTPNYDIYQNCEVISANPIRPACKASDRITPDIKPYVDIFLKWPTALDLQTVQRSSSVSLFDKEVIRGRKLARETGLMPPFYDIFLKDTKEVHPIVAGRSTMAFQPGVEIFKVMNAGNAYHSGVRAHFKAKAKAALEEVATFKGVVPPRPIETLKKALKEFLLAEGLLLRDGLIHWTVVWNFAMRLWSSGFMHCDFHMENVMTTNRTISLEHGNTEYLTAVKKGEAFPIDLHLNPFILDEDQVGEAQLARFQLSDIFAIDPGFVYHAEDELSQITPDLLQAPCSLERAYRVEDINHIMAYSLLTRQKMDSTFAFPLHGSGVSADMLLKNPIIAKAFDQWDELNERMSATLFTRLLASLESAASCLTEYFQWMNKVHVKARWDRRIAQPVMERAFEDEKDLFSRCTLADYFVVGRAILKWLDFERSKFMKTAVWGELSNLGYEMPQVPSPPPFARNGANYSALVDFEIADRTAERICNSIDQMADFLIGFPDRAEEVVDKIQAERVEL